MRPPNNAAVKECLKESLNTFSVTTLLNSARNLGSPVMLGIMLFFYTVYAQAGQVTLAWNANTDPTLGGYRLYYGQASGNYTANVDVGKQTSYTLTGLTDGKTYYFAAKAYNTGKTVWSGFSNQVSKTIATTAPEANFSASPTSGPASLEVIFTNSSTNATAYSWDFNGDGTTDTTAQNPAHTYTTAGTYTVSLTARG